MPPPTEETLAAMKARCDAAGKGSTKVYSTGGDEDNLGHWYVGEHSKKSYGWLEDIDFGENGKAIAVFFAHARTDMPRLIAAVEHCRMYVAKWASSDDYAACSREVAAILAGEVPDA
jgi:hypothetical protein